MTDPFTDEDWGLLFESLDFAEQAFREYASYPSYEFKCRRIDHARSVRRKLRTLKNQLEAE